MRAADGRTTLPRRTAPASTTSTLTKTSSLRVGRLASLPPKTTNMQSSMAHTAGRSYYEPVLSPDGGINPRVENMQYAVRGELVLRAQALSAKLTGSDSDTGSAVSEDDRLPFDRITYCNIGNPQSVGQAPVTYIRQVIAAVVAPDLLLDNPATLAANNGQGLLPPDVIQRARSILEGCHGVGAYSESKGIPCLREDVAEAITERDGGIPADPDLIFLTNGASDAVKVLLSLVVRGETDGVLVPIPQYPLYSATLQAMNGSLVGYYLQENNDWGLDVRELEKRVMDAREAGTNVRALCVINPGNPTGQTLSHENMAEIVRFCERERLVLMADEVYQKNVYNDRLPFVSFKRVVAELGSPIELASFHSVSKGVIGECGLRGGYVELHNMHPHAVDMVYKSLSVSLCANVPGQIAVALMMKPPKPGDASYELYERETRETFESLKRKGAKIAEALNTFEGVSCNPPQGAMYLFPQVRLPQGAIEAANARNLASADILYCLELLDATGICVVPGSGFEQEPGTLHFRTTFLPPENQIEDVVTRMRNFHEEFLSRYSS